MEFYHLRSFVAVADTGNLTQAAKRLYTTPPAISAHIKALEEELATPLFTRSHKGMLLTEKGQLLLTKAQVTLDSAVDLVNFAAINQHQILGDFSLAINIDPEQVKLTELISVLKEDYPGITLITDSQSSGKTLNDIQGRLIDGGYIFGEVPNDCLAIKVLMQKITTIAPLSFKFKSMLPIADLAKQPWIMMGEHCPFDDFLKSKLGEDIPAVIKTADDGTRLTLVKNGLGLSFIEFETALSAEKNQQVQIIPTLDFTTELHFIVLKSRVNEPVIKATLAALKGLWG